MGKQHHHEDKSKKTGNLLLAVCATAGVLLVAVIGVWAARAFIYTETDWVESRFGQFTYTNTETVTPSIDFNIQVNTSGTITGSNLNQSYAAVKSEKGRDKKPAFVRAFVVMNIYSDSTETYDITLQHTQYYLDFTPGANWTRLEDGYYYYNKVLRSGETTSELLSKGSVSLQIDEDAYNGGANKPLPDGAVVKIFVLADTMQAVSSDSSRWTTEELYNVPEVALAWSHVSYTVSPALDTLSEKERTLQDTDVTITWTYNG